MRLSANAILMFNTVNSIIFGDHWTIRKGDAIDLYFQIVDLDQAGLRYMVGQGSGNTPASIAVIFPSVDDSKVITLSATQADAADPSIWKVTLSATQTPNSGNVIFQVTEGSKVRNFSVMGMISVEFPMTSGSC